MKLIVGARMMFMGDETHADIIYRPNETNRMNGKTEEKKQTY